MHAVCASFVGSPVFGAADLLGSAAMTAGLRTTVGKAKANTSDKTMVFITILLFRFSKL